MLAVEKDHGKTVEVLIAAKADVREEVVSAPPSEFLFECIFVHLCCKSMTQLRPQSTVYS